MLLATTKKTPAVIQLTLWVSIEECTAWRRKEVWSVNPPDMLRWWVFSVRTLPCTLHQKRKVIRVGFPSVEDVSQKMYFISSIIEYVIMEVSQNILICSYSMTLAYNGISIRIYLKSPALKCIFPNNWSWYIFSNTSSSRRCCCFGIF